MITTSLKKLYRRRTAPAIFSSAILLTAVLLLASLASCGTRNTGGNSEEFDQPAYLPSHASGFRILGAEGHESVILESFDPWQGADSMTTRLFIARGGESAPDGFDGPVLNGEAKRIVAMSSTHIAMLDAFGKTDRVKGVSGIDFISNPTIQSRRDSIGDVGYEGNIDYELLLALDPDIVLLFSTNGASRMEGKLDELGIPYAYIGDYLESSPLG
ncbi:MAG: ABC transporter substrate-binding protein, partial [Paramuribaculum sp.]|nr:ABC transporter substrate-binding protein [Paramuribaculum sp.]